MVDTAPTSTTSEHAGITPSLLQPVATRESSLHEGLEFWLLVNKLLIFPAILRAGSLGVITEATRKNAPNHEEADVADDAVFVAVVVVVAVVVADAADPSRRFHRRRRAARGRAP